MFTPMLFFFLLQDACSLQACQRCHPSCPKSLVCVRGETPIRHFIYSSWGGIKQLKKFYWIEEKDGSGILKWIAV